MKTRQTEFRIFGLHRRQRGLFTSVPKVLLIVLLILIPGTSLCINLDRSSPYIERHEQGWIDWENGLIYGIGRAYLESGNSSRLRALGAANLFASGNIIKLAAGIHLDDRRILEKLGGGNFVVRMKAFLRDREHDKSFVDNDRPYYEVTRVARIKGIDGLTFRILEYAKSGNIRSLDMPSTRKQGALDDEDNPWLVLDARKLSQQNRVEPAIFPKIVDTSGKTVYSIQNVNESALIERGMISYVVSDRNKDLLSAIMDILPVREAHAFKKTRSMPSRSIVKAVVSVQGVDRTDLVVWEEDAVLILKEDLSSGLLENCRVIVVLPPPLLSRY
jgi:hypothetical protein